MQPLHDQKKPRISPDYDVRHLMVFTIMYHGAFLPLRVSAERLRVYYCTSHSGPNAPRFSMDTKQSPAIPRDAMTPTPTISRTASHYAPAWPIAAHNYYTDRDCHSGPVAIQVYCAYGT